MTSTAAPAPTVKAVTLATSEKRANELLAAGWSLLATAPGKDETGYPITHYSLGWTKDTPAPSV